MLSINYLFEFDVSDYLSNNLSNGSTNGLLTQPTLPNNNLMDNAARTYINSNSNFKKYSDALLKHYDKPVDPEQARINMRNANMTPGEMENLKRGQNMETSVKSGALAIDPKTGQAMTTSQQLGVGANAVGQIMSGGAKTVGNFVSNNPSVAAAAGLGAGAMYMANRNKNRSM